MNVSTLALVVLIIVLYGAYDAWKTRKLRREVEAYKRADVNGPTMWACIDREGTVTEVSAVSRDKIYAMVKERACRDGFARLAEYHVRTVKTVCDYEVEQERKSQV